MAGLALALVLVPLAVAAAFVWGSGRQLLVVESGSMAPTYGKGALLVVAPAGAEDLALGDVLVFQDGRGRTVSHRVMGIETGEDGLLRFRTRGDANEVDDPELVPATAVRGRVERHLPGLGSLAQRAHDGGWAQALAAVPLALLAVDGLASRALTRAAPARTTRHTATAAARAGAVRTARSTPSTRGHAPGRRTRWASGGPARRGAPSRQATSGPGCAHARRRPMHARRSPDPT